MDDSVIHRSLLRGGQQPEFRELPILLKSLTQSFPLEWRDVPRYQRLRKLHTAHSAPLLTLRGHSVQRRQLIATWSMGVPVLTAMYSRAIGSTSRGKRACVSPPSLGMWTIHQPPSRVTSISKLDIGGGGGGHGR